MGWRSNGPAQGQFVSAQFVFEGKWTEPYILPHRRLASDVILGGCGAAWLGVDVIASKEETLAVRVRDKVFHHDPQLGASYGVGIEGRVAHVELAC